MNGQKINIIFLNTSPGSVYCLRLSVWKITKYKIYQNEERISFLSKVNSDQRKQSRAKLYAKSCQIPRVAWILLLRWNLHIKTCVFVTFWNMLRDSKCCKANFLVIIDNTKNNFSEFFGRGEPPAELYVCTCMIDSISFHSFFNAKRDSGWLCNCLNYMLRK